MRKQIVVANWKMNLTLLQAEQLINEWQLFQWSPTSSLQEVIFAVPFPYLIPIYKQIGKQERVSVIAQNCAHQLQGAFTGEVSVTMLKSIGIKGVIIGHSERRDIFQETNLLLKEKVSLAIQQKIDPIFCCGEPLSVREEGKQNIFVAQQLKESLFHLAATEVVKVVVAYEPIWAIGTGKTATAQQAEEMQLFIRQQIATQYSWVIANEITILYGGSVKANNAKEIFSMPNVDGGLIGGASLIAKDFQEIVKAMKGS